jgi:excisionase family DNA binding protein
MNTSRETPIRGHDDGDVARLITTSDLARRLGVTSDTIRKWARDGRIPCLRVGQKTLRFDPKAVLNALGHNQDAHREGGDA